MILGTQQALLGNRQWFVQSQLECMAYRLLLVSNNATKTDDNTTSYCRRNPTYKK